MKMDRKYSVVWKYFSVVDKTSCRASCSICGQTISFQSSISNLKRHLKFKHRNVQLNYGKRKFSDTAPASTNPQPSDTPVSLHDGDTGIFPSVELDETLQDLMGAPEERSRPAATEELIVPEAFPSLLGNRPQEVRIKEEPKSESEDGPQIVSVSSIEPEAHGSRTENPEVSVSRTERQEVPVPRKERPEAPVFRKETPVFRKERIDVQGKKMSAALTEALVRFSEVQAKQTAATEKLAAAIESSSRRFAEEMSTTMKILATVAQSQTQLMGILIDKCNKCGKCQKLD